MKKIACVVLNYKSNKDLFRLIPQLIYQNIETRIIVVDNNSGREFIKELRDWLDSTYPGYSSVSTNELIQLHDLDNSIRLYLIENESNSGYSTGNNLGLTLARKIGCDAALIVNPDVIIDDNNYLFELTNSLFESDDYFVAASRVLDLKGNDQNPQRESRYFEELCWPYLKVIKFLYKKNMVICKLSEEICIVEKVSGCCMLLKISDNNFEYFDEKVFLYCEEAILSAKLKYANKKIVFNPNLIAIHSHKSDEKQLSSTKSAFYFLKSRVYYLKFYSSYKNIRLKALLFSYFTFKIYLKIKAIISIAINKYLYREL
jgi:GT2 family glycosyltransferase